MDCWIKESLKLNKLNIGKCRIVLYGRKPNITKYDYFIGNDIERAESKTDFGVSFCSTFKIGLHI